MWGNTALWSSPPATPNDPTQNTPENIVMAIWISLLGFGWALF